MVEEKLVQISDDTFHEIRKKNCSARNEVQDLKKELLQLATEAETYENNIALLKNEQQQLNKELIEVKELTQDQIKELNGYDSTLQKPLQHYKDMKAAIENYSKVRENIQKLLSQMEAVCAETDKSSEALNGIVTTALATSKEQLQKTNEDSNNSITNLKTQLKIVEAKKKTLQSQLNQKTEENKELTKICEELISQRGQ